MSAAAWKIDLRRPRIRRWQYRRMCSCWRRLPLPNYRAMAKAKLSQWFANLLDKETRH